MDVEKKIDMSLDQIAAANKAEKKIKGKKAMNNGTVPKQSQKQQNIKTKNMFSAGVNGKKSPDISVRRAKMNQTERFGRNQVFVQRRQQFGAASRLRQAGSFGGRAINRPFNYRGQFNQPNVVFEKKRVGRINHAKGNAPQQKFMLVPIQNPFGYTKKKFGNADNFRVGAMPKQQFVQYVTATGPAANGGGIGKKNRQAVYENEVAAMNTNRENMNRRAQQGRAAKRNNAVNKRRGLAAATA